MQVTAGIATLSVNTADIQKVLIRDCIYNIDMLFSKKGVQAFIYIYKKGLGKHRCSSPTCLFYAFCINLLKSKLLRGRGTYMIYRFNKFGWLVGV